MQADAPMSAHEKRLLHDFLYRRPRHLTTVNGLVGAIVIALFIWMFPESFAHLAVGGLGGALIGVYFEQRHILELRGIFKKACAGHPDASPAVDTTARNG
ncbi:hypothetical protein [Massilia aquatica]|uniref:DUF2273 domain-containing protein n=1 Tax=Massilia aquatica TaxID=2609000 RepID=A0ABX0M9X9_9BURK|nr:hypothetical protein [Massilia aquatica]NHZ43119.1 hypothetical protein [Massilia aquatica]